MRSMAVRPRIFSRLRCCAGDSSSSKHDGVGVDRLATARAAPRPCPGRRRWRDRAGLGVGRGGPPRRRPPCRRAGRARRDRASTVSAEVRGNTTPTSTMRSRNVRSMRVMGERPPRRRCRSSGLASPARTSAAEDRLLDLDVGHLLRGSAQDDGVVAELHLEGAPGIVHAHPGADHAPAVGGRRRCARPGATGERLARAALPHPQRELAGPRAPPHELDVRAAGLGALERLPTRRTVARATGPPSRTRCGLPRSTRRARSVPGGVLDAELRAEHGAAHVHAGGSRRRARPRRRTRRCATRPRVCTEHGPRPHPPGVDGRLDQTADAVPAHLRRAAVGVAQVHGERGGTVAGRGPQHPVGAEAPVAVAQRPDLGRRQPPAVLGVEQHEEVVPRTVVLGQAQRRRNRHHLSFPPADPPTPGPRGSGVPRLGQLTGQVAVGVQPADPRVAPEPRPLAAGERLGASHRLVHGLVERHAPLDVGEQLAVADAPGGAVRDRPPGAPLGCGPRRGAPRQQVPEPGLDAGVVRARRRRGCRRARRTSAR